MSFVKPKFVLLAFFAAALPLLSASACGGSKFVGADSGGSSGLGGSTSSGGSGTGATDGKSCVGPEDCNDGDPCTVDLCKADGTCATSPKCEGTEQCCDGVCAACCGNADCDDFVECTDNRCFMYQCMFVPNDGQCGATDYCAAGQGCRPKQACGVIPGEDTAVSCADEDACTTDSCGADNFCSHDYCATGSLCCEGSGCAEECCNDSQCKTDDPCKVGACEGGKCAFKDRCEDGQCCPSADGKSATCGQCCNANDCDDKIGCTEDACRVGQCTYTPKTPDPCPTGSYCDAAKGCTESKGCKTASDCFVAACQTAKCSNGVCEISDCGTGTKCCAGAKTCTMCCAASDCNDNIACTVDECGSTGCTHKPSNELCPSGQSCDAKLGCIQCTSAAQCDDTVPCTKDTCVNNKCVHSTTCSGNTPYCGASGCVACRLRPRPRNLPRKFVRTFGAARRPYSPTKLSGGFKWLPSCRRRVFLRVFVGLSSGSWPFRCSQRALAACPPGRRRAARRVKKSWPRS